MTKHKKKGNDLEHLSKLHTHTVTHTDTQSASTQHALFPNVSVILKKSSIYKDIRKI